MSSPNSSSNGTLPPSATIGVTTATTTTTTTEQHQQQQQQRPSVARGSENPAQWLERIRTVQLSKMTPAQRDEVAARANRSAEQFQTAKKWHGVSHRNAQAKTTSYAAMDMECAVAPRASIGRMLASAPSAPPSSAPGTTASGAPFASRTEQVTRLMDVMEDQDRMLQEAFSAPVARQMELAAQRGVATVIAQREEQMMTVSAGLGADVQSEQVTESEERAALASLRTEPSSDEECAAKFVVFEAFSNKVSKIRKDLDVLVRETAAELPPLPREAVNATVRKLEAPECRGIQDNGRYWFVHDMFLQVSKNTDLMQTISDDIARKVRLVARSEQGDCPVCLETFTTTTTTTAPDAAAVIPVVLGCCHSVCETCWNSWVAIRGANVYCPLCRHAQFVDDISNARPVGPAGGDE